MRSCRAAGGGKPPPSCRVVGGRQAAPLPVAGRGAGFRAAGGAGRVARPLLRNDLAPLPARQLGRGFAPAQQPHPSALQPAPLPATAARQEGVVLPPPAAPLRGVPRGTQLFVQLFTFVMPAILHL